jgi:hypothetical protein
MLHPKNLGTKSLSDALFSGFSHNPIEIALIPSRIFRQGVLAAYMTQHEVDTDMDWKTEFVSVHIPESALDKADKWVSNNFPDLDQHLTMLLNDGYKISWSYHANTDMYICSMTGTKNAVRNRQKTMSTWGHSPLDALGLALYKHIVICDNDDWGEGTTSQRRG